MAKATKLVGDVLLFLAGLVAGIILTIYGTSVLVTADSPMEKLNHIFLLPDMYYVVAAMGMVGLSLLLRKAADRMV